MTNQVEILVPNIGDSGEVDVIEVLVKPGDEINEGDTLITLESDKASMDIPAEHSGKVMSVAASVGDKVNEGSVIAVIELQSQDQSQKIESQASQTEQAAKEQHEKPADTAASTDTKATQQHIVRVPDIGDAAEVEVIEVLVSEGDSVSKDQALITLEGDKATMDIPSPYQGKVLSLSLAVGDKVAKDTVILTLQSSSGGAANSAEPNKAVAPQKTVSEQQQPSTPNKQQQSVAVSDAKPAHSKGKVYASPSVRRLAREFGVDLTLVEGSGRKGRVVKADVQRFVKGRLAAPQGNMGIPKMAKIDFSKFGEIETVALNKIKRLTAQNMQRAWLNVPHVTQFDEADITELENFRKANKERALAEGAKLTPLAFIVQAVVKALKAFPQFNASLDESGENLILKQYYNVGIAVDTPNGLVVPVIKDADKKGLLDLARAMAELSVKARNKALTPADMSGGCFTISSLGGIGGTAFTPIVNAPEVAILGVSRSQMKPVFDGSAFQPRLMLPLSLSYDHRVIDGAEAARFSSYLCQCLSDIRTLLL